MQNNRRITLEGFLRAFRNQDQHQPDQPFCFILGAGASKTSGIRTGAELAKMFLEDIHREMNFDGLPLRQWATDERLGVKEFSLDRAAEFYPQLYERRYAEHPDRGYAFLEREMEDKEPSYGYSVLAWILEHKSHKVVITTNFDNLVADALSIHSATFPRVVGHDSLVGFIKAALRRPLIAKVHGDLGFAPRNTPQEVERLSAEWKEALLRVLERFTPIVIGYAGNDGSLMTALESLPAGVPESVYWCQREGDAVSDRVNTLLEQRKGHLVLIPGFDEVMLRIQDQMRDVWKMPDLLDEMKDRQRRREEAYEKQRDDIGARLTARQAKPKWPATPPTTAVAAEDAAEDAERQRELAEAARRTLAPKDREKPWWEWQNDAAAEEDADKRDEIYQRGLQARPESHELMGNYAVFLKNVRKDYDRAEEYYKKALENAQEDADYLGNYALFLTDVRKDYDRAEEFYQKALEIEPENAISLGNYAIFLTDVGKDYDRAEEYYQKALEIEPENANRLGNYAVFLKDVRKDDDRAEEYYQKALEIGPENANNLGNYANFLTNVRKDYDRAEEYHQKALEIEPENAIRLGNYAQLLFVRGRKPEAMELLTRSESHVGEDDTLHIELLFYRIAHDAESWPGRLKPLRDLLTQGARSPNWPLEENVKRAEEDGHPNLALLRALAQVITDQSPLTSLDEFVEWREAAE